MNKKLEERIKVHFRVLIKPLSGLVHGCNWNQQVYYHSTQYFKGGVMQIRKARDMKFLGTAGMTCVYAEYHAFPPSLFYSQIDHSSTFTSIQTMFIKKDHVIFLQKKQPVMDCWNHCSLWERRKRIDNRPIISFNVFWSLITFGEIFLRSYIIFLLYLRNFVSGLVII